MLGSSPPLTPLLLAASRSQTWSDVLRAYTQCRTHLGHLYQPTTAELHHGLTRMPHSWAASLFYYNLIKQPTAPARPDPRLVVAMVQRHKKFGNVAGLTRVVDEDMDGTTLDGARAKIALATSTGVWETALSTLMSHPTLQQNPRQRRSVIAVLSHNNQWRLALGVLFMQPPLIPNPLLVRPLVRCFGRLRRFDDAYRLAARVLAAGHTFDAALLSALLTTLQETNQWSLALEAAQRLQLLSVPRAEGRRNVVLYNQLVDCLYEADPYGEFTVEAVVNDVSQRLQPRHEQASHLIKSAKPFRVRTHTELFLQFQNILLPLSQMFSKFMRLPRWYSRGINAIVTAAVEADNAIVVMDTNSMLQLVQKDLPLGHFYAYMRERFPDTQHYDYATVVVPFTVVQELYSVIWGNKLRLSLEVKSLLWSRVVALMEKPNVYALSLAGEYPSAALGIVSKLAYSKLPKNVAGNFKHDPDLRILNVCLSLQHFLREATIVSNMGGIAPVEGIALFAFLKYHVRRYTNTVKGDCVDRLVLCTMDRRMSHAARHLGIRVFPDFSPCAPPHPNPVREEKESELEAQS